MSRKYKFHNPEGIYFVSFAVVHWIDVFTRPTYKNTIVDGLQYCIDKKGLIVHAWVIMSNHVHLIISRENSGSELPDILRDFKKFTARKLIYQIADLAGESRKEWMLRAFKKASQANSNNTVYQFWQQHNKPIELTTNAMLDQKSSYIHQNPVRAGIVGLAEDYLYSSADDYAGGKGLLKIELLW
jgi:putative transposase